MKFSIRLLYLYLFSFVGLIVVVIGSIRLVELGLKVFVFNGADQYYYARPIMPDTEKVQDYDEKLQELESKRQRQREFSGAVSMIVIGLPLYLYHWSLIRNEHNNTGKKT